MKPKTHSLFLLVLSLLYVFQQFSPCPEPSEVLCSSHNDKASLKFEGVSFLQNQASTSHKDETGTSDSHSDQKTDCRFCSCPCHSIALEKAAVSSKEIVQQLQLSFESPASLPPAEVRVIDHIPLG